MTNNPDEFELDIRMNRTWFGTVKSFKYLGSIIYDASPEPETLFRIAQTNATLAKLKWYEMTRTLGLLQNIKLVRSLVTSTFLYACETLSTNSIKESRSLKQDTTANSWTSHAQTILLMRKYVSKSEIRLDLFTIVTKVSLHLTFFWHGKDNWLMQTVRHSWMD